MKVAGIDVDTKAAHYAVWDGKEVLAYGKMEKREDTRRLANLGVEVVYIEDIPWVNNTQTMRKLSEAVGRWKERLEVAGLRTVGISVGEWKMMAVGNGHASKAEVRDIIWATTTMPADRPEHQYDAAGIAIAGYQTEMLAGVSAS